MTTPRFRLDTLYPWEHVPPVDQWPDGPDPTPDPREVYLDGEPPEVPDVDNLGPGV